MNVAGGTWWCTGAVMNAIAIGFGMHANDFWFAHNPETLTYGREIGGAFDEECRLTIHEDGDGMLDEVWTVWCSDEAYPRPD